MTLLPRPVAPVAPARPAAGHLADNVLHFARLLRGAGLAVGPDRVHTALAALQVVGLQSRQDFHAVLGACLIARVEHRALFDQAFALFWRDPDPRQGLPAVLPPGTDLTDRAQPPQPENRRLADALQPPAAAPLPDTADSDPGEPAQAEGGWADRDALRQADFDSMTVDEWRAAQRLLLQLRGLFERLPTRRSRPAAQRGTPDWRATLAQMARRGGELQRLSWRSPRHKPAPLVVLADISGSMSRYSRMLLHFAHGLGQGQGQGQAAGRIESFVFGTRLTRITRLLKQRDPDQAVGQVVQAVADWSGGTRITSSLQAFNQRWARRVLSGQATVLLISDGLEHGDTADLAFEMERLHKSCRRLIWLNPLLRFAQFEPRAAGIKAMLPHVDQFLPAHNLHSLADLVQVLGGQGSSLSPHRP
jgi:uncharacterized protein with von Willebrand factor type A (vWA) domain